MYTTRKAWLKMSQAHSGLVCLSPPPQAAQLRRGKEHRLHFPFLSATSDLFWWWQLLLCPATGTLWQFDRSNTTQQTTAAEHNISFLKHTTINQIFTYSFNIPSYGYTVRFLAFDSSCGRWNRCVYDHPWKFVDFGCRSRPFLLRKRFSIRNNDGILSNIHIETTFVCNFASLISF